jgi:hypothetical protein
MGEIGNIGNGCGSSGGDDIADFAVHWSALYLK